MADPATPAGIEKAVAAPAWEAVKCSCSFCCTRGDYFSDLKDNLRSLGEQMHQLQELMQQVETRVAEERKKSPRLQQAPAVTYWLNRVIEMEDSVIDVTQEGNQELKEKWLRWFFPKSRCAFNELGTRVSRKVAEVKELVEKGGKLGPLVERKPPSPVDEWQIRFDPRGLDSKLQEAWIYLEDPCAKIIGIHGPRGVGKTTLLKMINNKLRGTGLGFDVVIWAVVSREGTVKKVQESILSKLEVPKDLWQDKSEADRAKEILEVLREKKFVLLLDDLQVQSNQAQVSRDSSFIEKREDLITVGVPLDGNNGSKVFFTTRSVAVCGKIGADKSMRVDCLPPGESLELFQSCVGEDTLNTPKIRGLARTLAAMCHGLSLVLVAVGRAMAHNKNPRRRNNAVEDAKRHRSNLPGVAKAAAVPAVKCSFSFCCTRGDYFADLKDNLSSLGEQMHQLQELKQQVETQVAEERSKSPRLRQALAVTYWLNRVIEMEDSVTDVTQEGNKELEKKWLRWFFPKSCCAFNEVGRRVSRKVAEATELVEKQGKLGPLVERKPPCPVDEWQIGFNPGGLDSKLQEAWVYLEDPCAKIIGIQGPGGVGKTTLLKMINNRLRGTGLGFDVVFRATEGTVEKVQESILDKLEVPKDLWQDKSEADRAKEILEVLTEKKFVLLLDDLRVQSNQAQVSRDSSFIEKREDLITVGVPLDGNNGSKVFFTTRSVAVCEKIGADKRIDCFSPNKSTQTTGSLASTLAAICRDLPLGRHWVSNGS